MTRIITLLGLCKRINVNSDHDTNFFGPRVGLWPAPFDCLVLFTLRKLYLRFHEGKGVYILYTKDNEAQCFIPLLIDFYSDFLKNMIVLRMAINLLGVVLLKKLHIAL